jgi:outer membrane lipoprotein SlyB
MRAKCEDCGKRHDLEERVFGKLVGGAAGGLAGIGINALFGNKLPANVVGAVTMAAGAAAGHYFSDAVDLPDCPSCRGVLRLVNAVL